MEENLARTEEGKELLDDQLSKTEEMARLFLPAIKGFRRDLNLSLKACGKYLQAEFTMPPNELSAPKLLGGRSFADLREFLELAERAIEGGIAVENPPLGPDSRDKAVLLEEIEIVHKNLAGISDLAHRLYETIQSASFEFDVFNAKNIEAEYPEANILFDRDELNVAMGTARAISERAVRMDIDLMEAKKRLEAGSKQER